MSNTQDLIKQLADKVRAYGGNPQNLEIRVNTETKRGLEVIEVYFGDGCIQLDVGHKDIPK